MDKALREMNNSMGRAKKYLNSACKVDDAREEWYRFYRRYRCRKRKRMTTALIFNNPKGWAVYLYGRTTPWQWDMDGFKANG